MFTMSAQSTRMAISVAAAVAIVSFSAVALDQAHIASAPRGTVEIGELTLVSAAPAATLPEVSVVARRESPADAYFAPVTLLPEVVVVAKRVAHMVAQPRANEAAGPGIVRGSAEGALLK